MSDIYHLARFVEAQDRIYEKVCAELRVGEKSSHWMWFIFPQLRGLGHSETATHFGISGQEEARAYLAHPVLAARLRECTQLVNGVRGKSASEIFGYPDDLKFRSSMTLFALSTSENQMFREALDRYFEGQMDSVTAERLGS